MIVMHFVGPGNANSTEGQSPYLDNFSSEHMNKVLAQYRMQNVHLIVLFSLLVSYLTYLPLCGWLHYNYYVKQRDQVIINSFVGLMQ